MSGLTVRFPVGALVVSVVCAVGWVVRGSVEPFAWFACLVASVLGLCVGLVRWALGSTHNRKGS